MYRRSYRPRAGVSRACARGATCVALSLALLVTACRGYQPRPLDTQAIVDRVHVTRASLPVTDSLTLDEATALLRKHNPEIREARAAWHVQRAVAGIKTPLPNPSIGFGPVLWGDDVLRSGSWGFEAALGWSVPLNNAQGLTDCLNLVRAQAALASAGAVERRQYLGLRADYLQAGLLREFELEWAEMAKIAATSVQTGQDMLEAGQASAVNVSLMRLDAARAEADVLDAAVGAEQRRQALAGRMGMNPERLIAPSVAQRPALPAQIPSPQELEQAALAGSPELTVLRAQYLVAEKQLRLEVARQTPDLDLGVGFGKDDLNALSLPIGIQVPIFDRNQVGIGRAVATREAARVRYRAEVTRLLARISEARAVLIARSMRLERMQTRVTPEAERTLITTQDALEAGATDALSYLAVVRTTRGAALDTSSARIAVYAAWSALEEACGVPLLDFPGAPGGQVSFPPAAPSIPVVDSKEAE